MSKEKLSALAEVFTSQENSPHMHSSNAYFQSWIYQKHISEKNYTD
jgi:hypothetical protein